LDENLYKSGNSIPIGSKKRYKKFKMSFLTSKTISSLNKEIQNISKEAIDGVTIGEVNDISKISAFIEGPVDTPFEGCVFNVVLEFGPEFPEKPPQGKMITKIFHPNVSKVGEICVNTLKKDWNPSYGIRHILQVIRCLLIAPNPASALNEEAGRLFQEDYEQYASKAKMLASIHAKKKKEEKEEESKKEEKENLTNVTNVKQILTSPTKPSVTTQKGLEKKKSLKRL
jgi:ubiquitin-protein ligase